MIYQDQELLFDDNNAFKVYKDFDNSYQGIKTKPIIDKSDFDRLTNDYTNWVNTDIHGCIKVFEPHNFRINCGIDYNWFGGFYGIPSVYKSTYKWFKLSKRGNDIYNWRLQNQLNSILSQFDNVPSLDKNQEVKTSNVLYFVFTFDPKVFKNINAAWSQSSYYINKFLSNISKRYGSKYHVRTNEAHKSGYLHVNCVVFFEDYDFEVFKHVSKYRKHKGKVTYRLKRPSRTSKEYNDIKYDNFAFLKSKWNGHLDIQAVVDFKSSLNYLFKYLVKDLNKKEATLTTVLNWYFNKRSFSLSNKINPSSIRLVLQKSNSNHFNRLTQQTRLNGDKFKLGFEFLGVFKLNGIKDWYFTTDIPPDEYIKSLNNFNNSIHN